MAENEYINRRGLQAKAFGKDHPIFFDGEDRANWYEKCINEMPAIDVAPARHGKWIYDHWCEFKCSECGEYSNSKPYKGKENFCPNCGAKMDGDKI